MEITLKKKDETDHLPQEEEEVKTPSIEEEKRRLEIENAEMRGRLSAIKEQPKATPVNSHEQTKQRVYADVASMDDEQFQSAYKMSKDAAKMTIMERETDMSRKESRRAIAEAEAKAEMGIKYGADFYRYKNHIEEAVADLSDEAKSDPQRLSRAMERIYLSLQKEGVIKTTKDDARKKIVPDFEKPMPGGDKTERTLENDEVVETYRPFSKVFGIRSEKERKDLMKTIDEGEFVPMDMGNGYWFKNPARGFERVERKA